MTPLRVMRKFKQAWVNGRSNRNGSSYNTLKSHEEIQASAGRKHLMLNQLIQGIPLILQLKKIMKTKLIEITEDCFLVCINTC